MKSNSKQHTTNETLHSLSMTTHSGTHSSPTVLKLNASKHYETACTVYVMLASCLWKTNTNPNYTNKFVRCTLSK